MANEMKVTITGDASSAMAAIDNFTSKIMTSVDEATGGLGKLALGFGGVAGIASVMAGKVMEGMKEVAAFIPEASAQVNELSRTFEGLAMQTGESLHGLSIMDATMKLTGGSVEELGDWLKGVTRAMKANADVFVENGIAASKSALMQMQPIDVMRGALGVIESETDQTKKLILAQELLGRGGIAEIPQMHRFFETLGEGEDALKKYGAEIDQSAIERMQRMEKTAGELTIQMDALKRGVAESYEPWDKFFAMMNRGLLHIADFALQAVNGIGPLLRTIMHPLDAMNGVMADEAAGISSSDPELQREQMRSGGHALGGSHGKTKEDIEAAKAAKKAAAAEAKTAKEVLNSLQETGNRLEAESLKTLDASTIALKKQRDEKEAEAKLDEEYHKIEAELAKADTPENQIAAQAARAAAYKAYTDRLIQITRDSNAAQLVEEAAKQAALEVAQKKALEDLKKDLAERSLIQGKLSRDETDQVLNSYAGKGANEAGAVAKYKLEVHWDESGSAGAMAGLKQFLASTESSFVQWKGFTTQILGGLEDSFAKFFTSLTQRGQTLEQKLKGLFSSIANDGVGALSKMLAQQLVNWGVDKAKAAWDETASAKKIAGILADSAATDASTTNQVAADATTTASANVATAANEGKMVSGALSAYAGIPWVGVALAAAAVVAMMAIMHSATGRQVGGLVGQNGPELTMLGERGLEVVAPEHDFKDWAHANQNLGANIGAHQARISSLQSQAGSYGSQGLAQSGGSMPSGVTIDARGAIFASTTEGKRAIDQMVSSSNQRIGRSSG